MEAIHERRFVALYGKYFHQLKTFVSGWVNDKYFAEDVVQETFTWLWEHRDQLDHVTNLNPFLYSIAKHKVYNYLRHDRIKRNHAKELISFANTFYSDQSFELNDTITVALKALTQKEREVFSMSRIEGLDNQEISNHLRISRRTVENHLTNCLKKLRKYFKNNRRNGRTRP